MFAKVLIIFHVIFKIVANLYNVTSQFLKETLIVDRIIDDI